MRTLFHEFGPALHGLRSNVRFERLSGTSVLRDFVERPSQRFEHWAMEREVLERHAGHSRTGDPMPDALIGRLEGAAEFDQGCETLRCSASAIVDMATPGSAQPAVDVVALERRLLAQRGLPHAIGPTHRLPHFQHLFSASSHAAGSCAHSWAEVLDAHAFEAFKEAGKPFDPASADRPLRCICSVGDSVEPGATCSAFRGRDAGMQSDLGHSGCVGRMSTRTRSARAQRSASRQIECTLNTPNSTNLRSICTGRWSAQKSGQPCRNDLSDADSRGKSSVPMARENPVVPAHCGPLPPTP